jgi:carboxyl-terminal processing protease
LSGSASPDRGCGVAASVCTALLTLLAGCGGGGGGSGDGDGDGGTGACGETARKQWVLNVARDWYLFPETLPASIDLSSYATAEALLDGLTENARVQGKDRFFSYLTTRAAENSLLGEGEFVGFGFRNRTDPGNRPLILDVFDASPAADAGLLRGDEIVAVDEGSGYVPVSESLAGGSTLSDLLGPATAGVMRGLRLQRNGTTFDARMTKRTVSLDPVPNDYGSAVLPLAGTTGVGYLHLRSYVSTADAQLRAAFADFRARGLDDFIVDLRYNGGGLVSTAELVDNLLGATRSTADVQFALVHNAARSNQNATVRFAPQAQSVRPVRIAFLTTEATASASEINVNAMQPYVEVAIVGGNTLGKPVGQLAFDLAGCEDRLRLVAFKTVNSLGAGDYYAGLAPMVRHACVATDTPDAPLGSVDDRLVQEALYWLANGACRSLIAADTAGEAFKPDAARETRYPRQRSPAEHWLPGVQ